MIITVGTHNLRLYDDDERRSFAPLSNRIGKTKTARLILLEIDLRFGVVHLCVAKTKLPPVALYSTSRCILLVVTELEYARPSSTEHLPTNTPETSTSTLAHHNALLPSRFREGILQRSTHRFTVRLFPPKWGFSLRYFHTRWSIGFVE